MSRHELSRLNSEIASAIAERDEAQRQVDRLERPTALLAEVTHEYAVAKAAHDAAITRWYEGGCVGYRPSSPTPMLELERKIGELRHDVGASDGALQTAREALGEQNARGQKASATYRAAAEAVIERVRTKAHEAMIESLRQLLAPESVAAELSRIGVRDPEALSAARSIQQAIFVARSSLAVRADPQLAADFLQRLGGDPYAELPAPQHAEVVHVDPPIIKPMEDGTKHLNRGPPEPTPGPVFPTDFGQPEGWAFMPPRGAAA
jgi:hypothetical protein